MMAPTATTGDGECAKVDELVDGIPTADEAAVTGDTVTTDFTDVVAEDCADEGQVEDALRSEGGESLPPELSLLAEVGPLWVGEGAVGAAGCGCGFGHSGGKLVSVVEVWCCWKVGVKEDYIGGGKVGGEGKGYDSERWFH